MDGPEAFPAYDSAPQGDQTVIVINEAGEDVEGDGTVSPDVLARGVEEHAENAEAVNWALVSQYVAALRDFSHGAVITTLPEGVGGRYDGSHVEIAMCTVDVGSEGVTQTIARMKEVMAHEAYHAVHNHTSPMIVAPDAGPHSVVIAGEGFDATELIEGDTVAETGSKFASDEYLGYVAHVRRAAANAVGINFPDIVAAVNDRDLRNIDDGTRAAGSDLAMAA